MYPMFVSIPNYDFQILLSKKPNYHSQIVSSRIIYDFDLKEFEVSGLFKNITYFVPLDKQLKFLRTSHMRNKTRATD